MKHHLFSIIPARGGSKGIPQKNIGLINNKPLIAYTIEASLKSKYINRTIVSTDNDEIEEVAKQSGAEIINRPSSLAEDATPTEPVIGHVLEVLKKREGYLPGYCILLQPTSPLRSANEIDEAYNLFIKKKADSLLSVCRSHNFLWRKQNGFGIPVNYDYKKRPRRQEISEYRENGAIYIFKTDMFLAKNNRLGGKILLYEMDEKKSVEIDTPFDLMIAENLLRESLGENSRDRELHKIIKKLKMVITDVDGVLTDGGMYYDKKGEAMKLFNTRDGMGFEILQKIGLKIAIVTKENSPIVIQRAKKLKIKDVFIGINDKTKTVRNLARRYKVGLDEICYIGDDINDLYVMKMVGFPVAVNNAAHEVKFTSKHITKAEGGKGAVREVCDFIVKKINQSI